VQFVGYALQMGVVAHHRQVGEKKGKPVHVRLVAQPGCGPGQEKECREARVLGEDVLAPLTPQHGLEVFRRFAEVV